jgi:hypothetical protein
MPTFHSRPSFASAAHLAALLAVGFAACGTTRSSFTGASPVQAGQPVTTVVLSETLADVEVGGERVLRLQLPQRGDLVLTVRWDDPNNEVVAFLLGEGCSEIRFTAAECDVRRSTARQGREGREEYIERSGATGAFWIRLRNEGPGAETIRVRAELITTAPAPAPDPDQDPDRPERERPHPRQSGRP